MEIKEKLKSAFKTLTVAHKGIYFGVSALEKAAEVEAGSFKQHYASKKKVLEEIFVDYYAGALDMARADEVYREYISRQKLLSFYFSLMEVVRPDREFISILLEARPFYEWTPDYLEPLKSAFLGHVRMLIEEGVAIEEVETRLKLVDYYSEPHWYQFLYILSFWTGDASQDFEKTDEAIEKSVNLGFDLMGRNVLDTAWEFGKFWWTNK